MERCEWCEANELLRTYHDREWGVPVHDDRKLFEFLMMEVMQLSLIHICAAATGSASSPSI